MFFFYLNYRPFRTTCRNYIDKLYKMTESTAQEVFSKILEQNNWSDNDPKVKQYYLHKYLLFKCINFRN